uniref:Ig-like domain-containing protein n=1 Tax=Pelusios castaneus TaxID=367368 RepID=A0A8C8VJ98_9SAUR
MELLSPVIAFELQMGKLRHRGGSDALRVHKGSMADRRCKPRTPASQPLCARHCSLRPAPAINTFLTYWLYFPLLFMGKVQSAPDVIARFGEDITLSCFFPAKPGMDLQRLTITWQKEMGAEVLVVHSYYYGRDQLTRQAEVYRHRTQVNPEGLDRGNVSLTLSGVRSQDEGIYRCYVHSELGETSEHWELRVGAPFSEPQLTFSLSSGGVTLTVHTAGGYPEATVQWLDEVGGNITAAGTTEQRDEQGLYEVTSWVTVPPATHSTSLTFLLTPRVLGAPITRPLSVEDS